MEPKLYSADYWLKNFPETCSTIYLTIEAAEDATSSEPNHWDIREAAELLEHAARQMSKFPYLVTTDRVIAEVLYKEVLVLLRDAK